jgi:hypothetical protein
LNEEAFVRLIRDDYAAVRPALQVTFSRVEAQSAELLRGSVTGGALLQEERANLRLEKLGFVLRVTPPSCNEEESE